MHVISNTDLLEHSLVWYEVRFLTNERPGLLYYYFIIETDNSTLYYGNNDDQLGGLGQLTRENPSSWQITVYETMQIPEWYKRGVMYQICVDRFHRGADTPLQLDQTRNNKLLHLNWDDIPYYIRDAQGRVTHWDFFGGNLQGIIDKLAYLQELGISILYLNPIFEAYSNHKYDTGDYHKVDPMFGDDETFDRLISTARSHGIEIILDGVFSHTGDDSLYFNKYGHYSGSGAYQSVESPYYSWYKFTPGSREYKSWWNIDVLPEVEEMNASYRQFIYGSSDSVVHHWSKKGIRGWRLDVADELPDEFIKEFRQELKKADAEAILIGEVWENATNKVSYGVLREYFGGHELDGTMNYPFREIFLQFFLGNQSAQDTHRLIMSLYETYPRENFYALMNLMGSHDRARILTLLGNAPPEATLSEAERCNFSLSPDSRRLAMQRLRLFYLTLMTFPGVPNIYYGDEAGLEGYTDPYNRKTYPWGKEDEALIEWVQRLIRLRSEYEVLVSGDFHSRAFGEDIYGFMRTGSKHNYLLVDHLNPGTILEGHDGQLPRQNPIDPDGYDSHNEERIIVLINRSTDTHQDLKLAFQAKSGAQSTPLVVDLLSGETICSTTIDTRIEPLSGKVFLVKPDRRPQIAPPLSRSCGVLLHISSLPSSQGSGDLGDSAYRFVDLLRASGQSIWQVLPLNPTGLGNSPYQSSSVFAGNPAFISLDLLSREGLLNSTLLNTEADHLQFHKTELLRRAYQAFHLGSSTYPISLYLDRANYSNFIAENADWLDDYALFQALKVHFNGLPWYEWESGITQRTPQSIQEYTAKLAEEIDYQRFLQYTFFYQWKNLKSYASERGLLIVGDMPLYVAADSSDVWANPSLFKLKEAGTPSKVAGVPPDYFSETGQLWNNPLYDWNTMSESGFSWWKKRIGQAMGLFDYTRIDHFRGLEGYWEVAAGESTAINGHWLKGPGKRFFESLSAEFGRLPIFAEDLGIITPAVDTLRKLFGFAGMKVLQFNPLKDFEDQYAKNPDANYIYYSGTHDNNTLLGWYNSNQPVKESQPIKAQLYCRSVIEKLYLSPAAWVILPLQDILNLDSDCRMNIPGTVGKNWCWQAEKEIFTDESWKWLKALAKQAQR